VVIRRGRTTRSDRIGVTGPATGLGAALVERLSARPDVDRVVPLAPRGSLRGLGTVVHAAVSYDTTQSAAARGEPNVNGTAALFEAARTAGVARVVVVTSVDVLAAPAGARPPVPEDLPLREAPDSLLTGELLEIERLADHATRTGLEVVVLRPACVVGGPLGPAYDGALLSSLDGQRLLAVRGVEPLWQLCHGEDLLSALELAAVGGVSGSAVVASSGWLTQREVEQLSGRRRLELPASVAVSTAERLHRVGLTPGSPAELDRLLTPLVVDPARLTAAGWAPAWTSTEALLAYLTSRTATPGRTGTYTAAGATVALVGTAALVRRARRRRGR
jgi:nucleoside-diphosphate-sugar epimerase